MERPSGTIEANETGTYMPTRMKNPAMILPEAGHGIQSLISGIFKAGVPRTTLDPVHLRVLNVSTRQVGGTWGSGSQGAVGMRKER